MHSKRMRIAPGLGVAASCLLATALFSLPGRAGNYLHNGDALERWDTFRGARVAANAGPAPDGSNTADQVYDSTSENGARIYSNTVVADGGPYVFSCYLKAGTLRQVKLSIADGTGSSVRAYIQPSLTDQWQRYQVFISSSPAGQSLRVELYPGKFDKENGYVWAWGAQLESGATPSPFISEGSGTTPDATPPGTPTGLGAQGSGTALQISWHANEEADLTGYRLQRSANGAAFTDLAQPRTPSYQDSSVTPGVNYAYRVAAVDTTGNVSPYSTSASATLPVADTTPPAAPSALQASLVSDAVQLQWSAGTEPDLAGFLVERSVDGAPFSSLGSPSTPAYTDSAVPAGASCSYRVRAMDESGNVSSPSAVATVLIPAVESAPAPSGSNLIEYPEEFEKWGVFREARAVPNAGGAPSGASVADHVVDSLTQNGAHLYSNTVASQGGPYTLSCYFKAGTLGKVKLALFDASGGSVRGFVEPTLTGDWQRYTVTVQNVPKGGLIRAAIYAGKFDKESGYVWAWGAQLESGSQATAYAGGPTADAPDTTPPAVPTGLAAQVSGSGVQLSWNANREPDLSGYRLQRSADGTSYINLAQPSAASYLDAGVSAGSTAYYRVAAVDAAGNASSYSTAVSVSVPPAADTTPPAAPAGLKGALASGAVQLTWSANAESDLAGYRLERGVNSTTSFVNIASPTSAGHVDSAVQAGNSYSYRVRAVDEAGNVSGPSAVVTVSVPPADTAPSGALSVLSYGANPATGGDDASALQAAFTAAASQNKDVYLPAGHYYISRTVVFKASGRTIFGDGMTRTIIAGNTSSYNLLQLDRTRGAVVRDLRLEGSALNDDKVNVNRAVDCYATIGSIIRRVHCYGAGYIAFDNGGTGTVIEDSVIEDYGRIGYLANDGAIVRRCRFVCRENWNFTGEQHGIYAPAGRTNILIEDNEFTNCGAYAIQLWGSQSGVWTENVTIQRNTFTRCKNVLVVGAGSSGPSYRSVRFLGNTIRQTREKDIRIMKFNGSTASGTELLIEGNTFEDPGASYGFMVINYGGAPITGVRVRNNQFLCPNRASYSGIIHLQENGAPLSDFVVEGNLFQDIGHSGTSEKGIPAIWVRSGSAVVVQDNTFVHWRSAGNLYDVDAVRLEAAAQNAAIRRNVFQGTGLSRCYGVRVPSGGGSSTGSITSNQFVKARLQAGGVPSSGNTFQ